MAVKAFGICELFVRGEASLTKSWRRVGGWPRRGYEVLRRKDQGGRGFGAGGPRRRSPVFKSVSPWKAGSKAMKATRPQAIRARLACPRAGRAAS